MSLAILDAKMRFIKAVMDEKIVIYRQKKETIVKSLVEGKFPRVKDKKIVTSTDNAGYDYLIKISLYSFTEEEIEKLQKEHEEMVSEYQELLGKSIRDIWSSELSEVVKVLT